jgi:hypothetical protein
MKSIHGTLLERKDLSIEFKTTAFDDITHDMFAVIRTKISINDDILIFIDDNGKSKIIKTRYQLT